MHETPPAAVVSGARILLALNGLIWLLLAIFTLLRLDGARPGMIVVAVLMVGNAGAMLLAARLITRRRRIFYLFTLALLLVNIFLTFADQFGLLDLLTLLVDLVLLSILLLRWHHFLP
jgi:hypothetical protein